MKTGFTLKTMELLGGLARVRSFQQGGKKMAYYHQVEIDIYDDGMILTCTGVSQIVKCTREGTQRYKVTVPLEHFFQIVKAYLKDEITVSFEGDKMTCGNVTIGGVNIAETADSAPATKLMLPINYTDKDILKIRGAYLENKQEYKSLANLIVQAELRLEKNLTGALALLQEYGVSKSDLNDLVNHKLNS